MKYKLSRYIINMGLLLWLVAMPVMAQNLPNFTQLVEAYGPAVVNISTSSKKSNNEENTNKEKQPNYRSIPGIPEDSPFYEFFRRFFDNEGNELLEERPATSLGSGFIISADGYVVTNNHVINEAQEIIVRLSDRREFTAKLIGSDNRSDLALLKVEATDLPTVKLGSSDNLKVGEWVLAIGSPFGFDYSVTAGIVSAKGRSLPSDTYVPFIQTDVAINPGNSGGPLFNLAGEVIGVNSQIYSRTGGFMGLSFAIPVNVLKDVVEQLKAKGKVTRGWLGVLIQDVTGELAESFGMKKPAGALVAKVLPDSPAAAAKFQVGDIITQFNNNPIERSADLPPLVGSTPVDSKVTTTVIRQGKPVSLEVTIAELPPEDDIKLAVSSKGDKTITSDRLGLSVTDVSAQKSETENLPENGVLVVQVEAGAARDAGIRKGDVIVMINNINIKNVSHFKEILADLKEKTIPVLIHRQDSPLFLAIKVPAKK
jgi:serine protease Do